MTSEETSHVKTNSLVRKVLFSSLALGLILFPAKIDYKPSQKDYILIENPRCVDPYKSDFSGWC